MRHLLRTFRAGGLLVPIALYRATSLVGQQACPALDTVTVVASRTHVSGVVRSVDVITREQIDRSAARNLADVLSTVMGVDVYGRS